MARSSSSLLPQVLSTPMMLLSFSFITTWAEKVYGLRRVFSAWPCRRTPLVWTQTRSGLLPLTWWSKIKLRIQFFLSTNTFILRYDDLYRLTLEFTDGKTGATRDTVVERSVGDFIDENGVICQVPVFPLCTIMMMIIVSIWFPQDIVEPLVLKLHKSLSAGKKDK